MNLRTAGGFIFDFYDENYGYLANGLNDAYDGAYFVSINGIRYDAGGEGFVEGRLVTQREQSYGTLRFYRTFYVYSEEGRDFARYVDFVTNAGDVAATVEIGYTGNLGSDSSTRVWGSSSGDPAVGPEDTWYGTDDSADGGADPSLAHAFWGPGAGVTPFSQTLTGDNFQTTYRFELPAGETAALMLFAVQTRNQATARSQVESIYENVMTLVTDLSLEHRETIVNWSIDPDPDGDGFTQEEGDCDHTDPDINPEADEVCDGADNDCDGEIDEDEAVDAPIWFRDADEDGFGDPGDSTASCEMPEGYLEDDRDCDDRDAAVNPDGTEVCNEVDDDCDGEIDEGVTTTYYADFDRDGFGDAARTREACEVPPLHVENPDDCDDTSAAVNPGADEACNDIDDDCDGEIDEGLLSTFWLDDDRDGYGDPAAATEACSRPARHVANSDDCDDADRAIHPGAEELCDGVDNDCDGEIDDGAPTETFYADADGDGHGDPDAPVEACLRPEGTAASADDCDDTDGTVYPGASEVCDGIDNNCNDVVDEGVTTTFSTDADGDGFGDPDAPVEACELPEGAVENSDDCDDGDSAINPDAEELCDGIDNDCDGEIDDGAPTETFYLDNDEDGYGDPDYTIEACEPPPGYVSNAGDCDDLDAAVNPEADEACNGVDDDCNGEVDDGAPTETYYADSDGDGYGDATESIESCGQPEGSTGDDTDCDDGNSEVHPNAPELDDDLDNDCDGEIDEGLDPGGGDEGCGCAAAQASPTSAAGLLQLILGWLGWW